MARKTTKPAAKAAKNPSPKRATDDNYVAPKRKPKAEPTMTLTEVLAQQAAEDGKTVEEVKAELAAPAADAPKPERQPGTSNLACTIRNHRQSYAVALHPNGKKTQNNGDAIAQTLLRVPFADLQAFAATRLGRTYDQLNPGHQRMCIGNLIRGALKRAEDAGDVAAFLAKYPEPKAE